MKLRSSRVLKRGRPGIVVGLENIKSPVVKWVSRCSVISNSGKKVANEAERFSLRSNKSNSGKNGANEAEIGVCVDNPAEDLEMSAVITEGIKDGLNTDDKGLFLGSEVLDPIKDLPVSCPEGEIEEESVARVHVEDGNKSVARVHVEEGNISVECFHECVHVEEGNKSVARVHVEEGNKSVARVHVEEGNKSVHVEEGNKSVARVHVEEGNKRVECVHEYVHVEEGNKSVARVHIEEGNKSVERVHVEEGNKSSTSETDHGFKEEVKSALDCEHESQHVESAKLADSTVIANGDTLCLLNDSKNGDGGMDKIRQKKGPGRPRKKKRKIVNLKNEIEGVNGDGDECGIVKRKRGRKRKNMEGSEQDGVERVKKAKIQGEIRVSERVVRLRSMAVSGGAKVLDGGRPEKKIERRGRPRKLQSETNEHPSTPMKKWGRPHKIQSGNSQPNVKRKKETRGRPHKILSENSQLNVKRKKETRGRPRKIQSENSQPNVKQKKETRGRPHKIQGTKEMVTQKKRHKDMIVKKLKMRRLKLMAIKNSNNRLKGKHVKKIPKIGEGHNEGKGMGRGECKKILREKLVDILLKAGWIIDRRSRLDRTYQDMVYVEPSGRSHWSITKAYAMLTKKVKNGDADRNEVSAFIPIPDEEISLLFRHVDKELGYRKKKNRIWKDGKRIKKVVTTKKKKKDGKSKREKGVIVKSKKPGLLARGTEKGTKQDKNGGLLYNRKRNLLSWMIDSGVILSGWKVTYGKTRRQKRLSEGTITIGGIVCSCCNESMSISEFASHSGGKVGRGFDDIYLESGVSFRTCLLDSWRKEEDLGKIRFNIVDVVGDDPNDDTCNICGDGGNLICCDDCPSTFHQSCLDIQNFPHGDWHCIYCSCKFCGVVSVIAPDKPPSEMLSCGLCEEKFHQSCLIEVGDVDMDSNRPPFCGQKCQELFERLQTYIGVKNELEDGFSWTLLRRSDISQDLTIQDTTLKVESNSKLAVAFSVMDECFLPIVDERSGTSIIHNVVYNCGSNFRRLNYAGFFTVVLEKGDELITAASIRLHGSRLAEMPFIGTRHMYRRQGMCRRLLDAIESTLSSMGVEELIIPAIPALLQTWTKVFGFVPIENSKKQAIKCISMLVFPGIDMLQKPLVDTIAILQKPLIDTNDKNVSQTTIDCNEMPMDSAEITKDAIDYEKTEDVTVSTDACNDKNVSQFETTSSDAVDYEENLRVQKDAIDYEDTEEVTVLTDSCNDKNVSQFETTSSDAVDFEEKPGVQKDAIDYEQMENKLTISHVANSVCDLNFPVKNVNCELPETTGPISSDQLPPSESLPKCTIRPCSTESVTCGAHHSPESESCIENDGIVTVLGSQLTSKLVPKNTFDLNVHPIVVDSDIGDTGLPDSRLCDSEPLVLL